MIVSRLTKCRESTYEVEIEKKVYILNEETVLKYRLFKGYEISSAELDECIQSNELETIKKKAYFYYLRYQKNSYEIIKYLTDREITYSLAVEAVQFLEEKGLINEFILAASVAGSLARNSNGELMIRYKLKNRHFRNDVIEDVICQLAEEDIEEGKRKLYAKAIKKYNKLTSYEQKQKIKEVFYRHGYSEGFSS